MHKKKLSPGLLLATLGVVYGDIGTSPLYSLKESLHHTHGIAVNEANIFGILSLIFWSLILIITLKYHLLILKADNNGEGGILALTALVSKIFNNTSKRLKILTLFGLFGTALLFGDGIITPAISVLSAVEGLELVQPKLHSYIVPITCVILALLFSIQRHGTDKVGRAFGPVTLIYFITIAVLGVSQIIDNPHILMAASPHYALNFFMNNGWTGFVVLGSVFLVVTGGEALYSDLGHFGRHAIDMNWFTIVLPCLLLNYFGQGALLLSDPTAIKNPFYLLAPEWMLLPLVILATAATVIASQALITGVFSLTMQAVQLQYFPRTHISHTSHTEIGQIYVGNMNWLLMVSCIALVVGFESSSNLAAAYGIAVTLTMLITTILFYFVAHYSWKWSNFVAIPLCVFFGAVEICFVGANMLKITHGGWFPLVVAVIVFTVMTTWNKGRRILSERMLDMISPVADIIARMKSEKIFRNPGVAVYMAGQPKFAPSTLSLNMQHYRSIHEKVVIVTVRTEDVPFIREDRRCEVSDAGDGFFKVQLHYGFMEVPDVPRALTKVVLPDGNQIPIAKVTYFLGQELLMASKNKKGMAVWRERLFAFMSRNSQAASNFFNLPPEKVITVSLIVEL
ncbi:MAG: potassium transporter Kup [Bacteriovoracaceae bacterium]